MQTLALLLAAWIPAGDDARFSEQLRVAARSATVRIESADHSRTGTAVIVGRRGNGWYALTAAHVVGAGELHVYHYPAATFPKPADVVRDVDVVARIPQLDLAVLRFVDAKIDVEPLRLANAQKAPKEEPFAVLCVGCDPDREPDCRVDRVSGKKLLRRPDGTTYFVWEAETKPVAGHSGGPLLDQNGRVLGICNGTQDGKGYYCHVDEIRAALKSKNLAWLWDDKKTAP